MVGPLLRPRGNAGLNSGISLERFVGSLKVLKHNDFDKRICGDINRPPDQPGLRLNRLKQLTIGLAISGGVDSMALALLCSQFQNSLVRGYGQIRFRAFVVDHGVRSESSLEAQSVAQILAKKQIPTEVLKIKWPEGLVAQSAPNFESLARTYRFQALGRACRDHKIEALYLAHHQDDQAETVLMRLVNGHRKRGLLGMSPSADIPECQGIYGVNRSGGLGKKSDVNPRHMSNSNSDHDMEDDWLEELAFMNSFQAGHGERPFEAKPMPSEHGGVRVYRPLLAFTKEELQKTCEAHGMPWFEDKTNADPTVTMRNAIRNIYKNHTLPVALGKHSILSLVKKLHEQRVDASRRKENLWSNKIQIMQFEKRVPFIWVYFETLSPNEVKSGEAAEMLLLVLRDALQKIASTETIDLATLRTPLRRLFPELESVPSKQKGIERKPFTVAGLMFQPLDTAAAHDDGRAWIIKPQPHAKGKYQRLTFEPLPPKDVYEYVKDPESWKLYDGRYWIRVVNVTSEKVYVRPFAEGDVNKLRKQRIFNQLLTVEKNALYYKDAKPRHVLPALVVDGRDGERVIGFPTLEILDEDYKDIVKYKIKYKCLND